MTGFFGLAQAEGCCGWLGSSLLGRWLVRFTGGTRSANPRPTARATSLVGNAVSLTYFGQLGCLSYPCTTVIDVSAVCRVVIV